MVDQPIARRVLEVIQPKQIELAIKALEELERRENAINNQWRMRIERAEYEANLAQRRYEKVDPSNRLVASTLERQWNDALVKVEEIKKEFSECSVFVFPSKEESFGIVLAEAEACGKPVVASNIGGIPYVVDDNKTGFLVEYGDVDTFAEKILILLNDKNLRNKMGRLGRGKAKQFSNKEIAKKYYELYKEVFDNEERS